MDWFSRLVEGFGGDKDAVKRARQESKHGRGKAKARNGRTTRHKKRKAAKLARRAQRGK